MPIERGQGDMLAADVDALVNTVNTEGVMGKGLALQVREAFPDVFAAYAQACKAGAVEVGRMHVVRRAGRPRFVVNFVSTLKETGRLAGEMGPADMPALPRAAALALGCHPAARRVVSGACHGARPPVTWCSRLRSAGRSRTQRCRVASQNEDIALPCEELDPQREEPNARVRRPIRSPAWADDARPALR